MTSPGSRQTGNSVSGLGRKRKGGAARRLRAAYPIVTLVEREGKSLIIRNSSRLRFPSPKGLFNRVLSSLFLLLFVCLKSGLLQRLPKEECKRAGCEGTSQNHLSQYGYTG